MQNLALRRVQALGRISPRRVSRCSAKALNSNALRRPLSSVAAAAATSAPASTLSSRSAANQPQTPVLKRFWTEVHVAETDGKLTIMLDHRVLKTPEGNPIILPSSKRALAAIVAQEWEGQEKVVRHHALPATSLVCKALDEYADAGARADKCADLLRYLSTDTICFQEDEPHQLVTLQHEHWDPLFDWVQAEFGVPLAKYEGILRPKQSDELVEVMRKELEGLDGLGLAAMERAVYYSKSFIIGLALARGKLGAEGAARAAHVEVQSQIARWGEVEDTHDVDYRDIRRHLASAALAFARV